MKNIMIILWGNICHKSFKSIKSFPDEYLYRIKFKINWVLL